MLTLRSCLVPILLGLAAPAAAVEGVVVTGPARIVDGDTLDVAGERIRLHGIDAPERAQTCPAMGGDWACGGWARDMLATMAGAGDLRCTGVERDRYARMVATCAAGGRDLGAAMVEAGAAVAFRRYSMAYVGQEAAARAAGRGLWAQGAAAVVTPSAWRQGQIGAIRPVAGDCAIKGNISANGRIYHRPGQRDYDRTAIDPARGERWFCSEDEARAAGWRPASR